MDNIMDDLTIEEKFRKRARKFSNICDKMSPQNIEELRKHDVEIDRYLRNISDFIGNSNPYWRVHPMFPNIRCSINGEIEIADRQFEVREHGGTAVGRAMNRLRIRIAVPQRDAYSRSRCFGDEIQGPLHFRGNVHHLDTPAGKLIQALKPIPVGLDDEFRLMAAAPSVFR